MAVTITEIMSNKPDISIIGPGKVGTTIGILAGSAGYKIRAIASSSGQSAQKASKLIPGTPKPCEPIEAASMGQLVLITVPDDAIGEVVSQLAEAGAFTTGALIIHCSGALPSEALAPARNCGCFVASMHPLQTFPSVESALQGLPGTVCFCEGDAEAVKAAIQLAADIGTEAVQIAPAGKALYHAAAVMACNHMIAGIDAALALAQEAGIDRQTYLKAAMPMIRAGIENVSAMGPAEALTGPVARGDAATIAKHLEAMKNVPAELRQFYIAAAQWTIDLALRKGTIDENSAEVLRKTLKTNDK